MTTYTTLTQPANSAFTFQATFDGNVYRVVATWNLFEQRYYVNVYDLGGNLVVSRALVGSPTGFAIEGLLWSNGSAVLTTSAPHGYGYGAPISLTVSACAPSAYNGTWEMFVLSPTQLKYLIPTDPGPATSLGNLLYNVDLVWGFFSSTLVYRTANNQFEVTP